MKNTWMKSCGHHKKCDKKSYFQHTCSIGASVSHLSLYFQLTPSRCYFLFHETVDTENINIYNKKDCAIIYNQIKSTVANGIVTLKRFREEDPYKDFIVRGAYEAMTGKQAPTAPLNLKM